MQCLYALSLHLVAVVFGTAIPTSLYIIGKCFIYLFMNVEYIIGRHILVPSIDQVIFLDLNSIWAYIRQSQNMYSNIRSVMMFSMLPVFLHIHV